MHEGAAEGREFLLYRARVVAFTVGLALVVAASFFAMHHLVTGRLLRTTVEEPWEALLESLEGDVFVLSALLADGRSGQDTSRDLGPRGLDPDRRVLAWVLARESTDDPGRSVVIDRYAQEPEGAAFATALVEEISRRGVSGSAPATTRLEGDAAIRIGAFAPELPVPGSAFAGAGDLWLERLRPVLEHLDGTVLPRLEREVAAVDSGADRGTELLALLEFYAALRTLVDDVLVPLSIGASGEGSLVMPQPLEDIARTLGEPPRPSVTPGEEVLDGWSVLLRAQHDAVPFAPVGRVVVGAAFASPQLALATQLDRRSRLLALGLMVLAALMGVAVARRTTRPLGQILAGIARFSGGDLEHRIDLARGGELATLARDLNQMAVRLTESERARRLASMGLVVGGAAHELKNPVHALDGALRLIDGYTEELFSTGDPAAPMAPERRAELVTRIRRLLEGGRENVDRMGLILEEIRVVNRIESDPREDIDLGELARRCVDDLRTRWEGQVDVTVETRGTGRIRATASMQRIPQNLIANALVAVEEARASGRDARRVRVRIEDGEGRVRLAVDDDGLGVDPAVRDRIFDLFFTTREVGSGSGLGLFLVHEIALAHGGTVRCESPGSLGGATFVVELPRPEGDS